MNPNLTETVSEPVVMNASNFWSNMGDLDRSLNVGRSALVLCIIAFILILILFVLAYTIGFYGAKGPKGPVGEAGGAGPPGSSGPASTVPGPKGQIMSHPINPLSLRLSQALSRIQSIGQGLQLRTQPHKHLILTLHNSPFLWVEILHRYFFRSSM